MEHLIDIILTLFWFVVVISIVVFLHEFGHFFFARRFGVKVEVFSIGFGKELFGWTDALGTRWKVSAVPLGGYVKMFGDANPASAPDFGGMEKLTSEERRMSFYFKPLWQKAVIVGAGPLANYATAIVIFTMMFLFYGKTVMSPEIGMVQQGSAAQQAGLREGDVIAAVDGKSIDSFNQLKESMALNVGDTISLKIIRGPNTFHLNIKPEVKEIQDKAGGKAKIAFLGIASKEIKYVRLTLPEAIYEAFRQSYNISVAMLKGIGQIAAGQRGTEEIGGPVKIATYSKESAEAGLAGVLWFVALISLNLGLVNLFPIPLLDGGHLAYYTIEAIRGRPLSAELQTHGFRIGFIILISLMLFAVFNDLRFLFGK